MSCYQRPAGPRRSFAGYGKKKEHRWQRAARSAGRQERGLEFPVFLRPTPVWGGCHSRKVRAISTARLNASRRLHLQPIDVVVSHGPPRVLIPGPASRLDAFSAYPFRAWLPCHAPGGTTGTPAARPTRSSRTSVSPRPDSTPATDRDRTVSRRSEPSSRATLMGEQPNPWNLLQPQDVTSRHRGAKPLRRFELLGAISLLSPEYLLSFERRPFHAEPPDHYAPVSCLLGVSPSQSSALMPLHSVRPVADRPEGTFGSLRYAFGGDHPSQTTRHALSPVSPRVSAQTREGPYFNAGSACAGAHASLPPAYPTHRAPKRNAKLQ